MLARAPRAGGAARNPAAVQNPPATGPEADNQRLTPNLRIDTNLVLIPVTVTTPLNQFVTGMEKENFRLLEDKVEQEITYFASFDAPLSVGLVFDVSGSMSGKLNKSRQAAVEFFKTANPEDEFFLVRIQRPPAARHAVHPGHGRDPEPADTSRRPRGVRPCWTAFTWRCRNCARPMNTRRALLVISDGGDNSSRYTESEVRNLLREADAQLYAMGVFEPIGTRWRTAEELAGPGLLSELATMTGGRQFPVENLNDLPDIAAKIGIELRNQYVLGYTSKNQTRDGKYRRVTVKLNQPRGLPPLRALYRQGYYAPSQ